MNHRCSHASFQQLFGRHFRGLFLSAALGGLVMAQERAATTATNQPSGSSRSLLEQAHYAETHQRDFAAAEAGYRQAVEVARAANDAKGAEAAQAALDALLVRQGKQAAQQDFDEIPAGAMQALSLPPDEATRDLVLYGDAVVPLMTRLALAATDERVVIRADGREYTRGYSQVFAVGVLAKIATQASDEALLRVLGSKDPVLRREVVNRCSSSRTGVLLAAAKDPVEAVRTGAVRKLFGGEDPRTAELARPLAAAGMSEAVKWLCEHDWRSAWDLAEKGIPNYDLQRVVQDLRNGAMRSEGIRALQEAVDRRAASTNPAFRKAVEPLLFQLAVSLQTDAATGNRYTPEALAALHAMARKSGLPLFIQVLSSSEADPAQRLMTAAAYVQGLPQNDEAVLAAVEQLLPERSTTRPVPSQAFLGLVAALAARTDSKHDLEALEKVASWWGARVGFAEGDAARQTLVAEAIGVGRLLRTTAQRNAAMRVATDLPKAFDRELDRETGLWAAGSFPAEAVVLVDWLMDTRASAYEGSIALAIQAACDPARALPLLCDLVANEGTIKPGGGQAAEIVRRALAVDPAAAKALMSERLERHAAEAASGSPAALARLTRQVHLTATLPPAEAAALLRKAAEKASPACKLRLASPSQAMLASGATVSPELLAAMVELLSSADLDADPDTLVEAVNVFCATLHEPALPLIGKALRSSSQAVRESAQGAMNAFRKQREALEEFDLWMQAARQEASTTSQLVALLASQDRAVVLGAVKALAAVKARNALPALVALLARDDKELTSAVDAAIDAMSAPGADATKR
jgi:hypothetical protein